MTIDYGLLITGGKVVNSMHLIQLRIKSLSMVQTSSTRIKTALNPRFVLCATEDKVGNIWLGTTLGPIYLSKMNVENESSEFTQHKIPRNDGTNYADYLLSNVEVRCIAVDAGNRKWMGTTNNGVYVISDDCNTQVKHFTTENSPLPSNLIKDIIIMPNGLVYFCNRSGIMLIYE